MIGPRAYFNPFHFTGLFLNPQRMSGNQIFSGAIEEISGIKWVNVTQDKYIFKTNNKHAMKTSEDVVLVFLLLFLTGIYLLLNKC